MYFHNENTMQQQTLRLALASFIGCLVKPKNVREYPSRHVFFLDSRWHGKGEDHARRLQKHQTRTFTELQAIKDNKRNDIDTS